MRRPSPTALFVAAILLVALVLRVWEVQRTSYQPTNDAASYLTLASQIAHRGDYPTSSRPGTGAGGTRGPSAYFPPGYPYFLAAVDRIDGNTTPRGGAINPARLSQAVLGTVAVGLVGLVALEAFGVTTALVALVLAAFYPVFIELSGTLVAENLFTVLVLAVTWSALRAIRSITPYRWIALTGLLAGLAILTHQDGIVLLLPLAIATLQAGRGVVGLGVLVLVAFVTLLPWLVRDEATMHQFVPVSDETGVTLVGTYNPAWAAYKPVPYKWRPYYTIPHERTLIRESRHLTEPQLSKRLQTQAFDYIDAHPLAPLEVTYHNSLRLLELEGSFAWQASAKAIDLPIDTARIGVISFWLLCAFAIAGLFTRHVRTSDGWLWLIPVLLWLSVALVNAETPRFREPIDPFLILLAACALTPAATPLRARLAVAPAAADRRPVVATDPGEPVEVGEGETGAMDDAGER